MPLLFPDVLLHASGMTEDEARVEIACRLFDDQSLTFAQAIQWSGLTRTGFESALLERGFPVFACHAFLKTGNGHTDTNARHKFSLRSMDKGFGEGVFDVLNLRASSVSRMVRFESPESTGGLCLNNIDRQTENRRNPGSLPHRN